MSHKRRPLGRCCDGRRLSILPTSHIATSHIATFHIATSHISTDQAFMKPLIPESKRTLPAQPQNQSEGCDRSKEGRNTRNVGAMS